MRLPSRRRPREGIDDMKWLERLLGFRRPQKPENELHAALKRAYDDLAAAWDGLQVAEPHFVDAAIHAIAAAAARVDAIKREIRRSEVTEFLERAG